MVSAVLVASSVVDPGPYENLGGVGWDQPHFLWKPIKPCFHPLQGCITGISIYDMPQIRNASDQKCLQKRAMSDS